MNERILVLVSAYLREVSLQRTLESFINAAASVDCDFFVHVIDSSPKAEPSEYRVRNVIVRRIPTGRDLFWAESVTWGYDFSKEHGPWDYVALLNEDVELANHAIHSMMEAMKIGVLDGVVGTFKSKAGRGTYGGYISASRLFPLVLRFQNEHSLQTDTFNANFVIIRAASLETVGGFPNCYRHRRADFDLGFSMRRAGMKVARVPGFQGTCEANSSYVTNLKGQRLREVIFQIAGPKGVPFKEHLTFTRRNAGPLWPLFFLSSYIRIITRLVLRRTINL